MPNTLKEKMIYLGLSVKKEFSILILLNILLGGIIALLIYFKVQLMIIAIAVTFIPLIDYLYVSRYSDAVKRLKEERNNEFVALLAYFEIFISNRNNVYKSFEMLIPYASEWMKERIDDLLREIDHDKSVAPFISFSNNFTYLVIQNVMISIYQMIDEGESNYALAQFDYLFASLNESLYHERLAKRNKSLDSMTTFPLVGAGVITVILTFSIMSILGDVVHVI